MHKNAAALIIVMLDCLELNMEVSDAGMETVESSDCREISKNNGYEQLPVILTNQNHTLKPVRFSIRNDVTHDLNCIDGNC